MQQFAGRLFQMTGIAANRWRDGLRATFDGSDAARRTMYHLSPITYHLSPITYH
jgi:hypothetical protein